MNSFELSKIFGPIFVAIIFIMAMTDFSSSIYSQKAEKPGYVIEVTETASTDEEEGEQIDQAVFMVASADIASGEKVFKKCAACHTVEEGAGAKAGPNLWNILNRPIASISDYKYSGALSALSSENWTYENLSAFLTKPKDFAKGTSMGFAGVRKDEDRAAVIAYLRSLSSTPADLPAAGE